VIALNKCLDKFFILNNNVKVLKEFEDNKIEAGKSLYEVIRIIDGKPLFLKRHLDRLENSARVTGLELWLGREEIKQSILKLIEKIMYALEI
jgi:Branched-chain amino acid aminotransferase/4-amino-4-deoxychorismate lyase